MTGPGSARTRAVDVDEDEQQGSQPATAAATVVATGAATVVVQAVVNGSSGVDATVSTPMLGDQKDSAAKYPDYQTTLRTILFSAREMAKPMGLENLRPAEVKVKGKARPVSSEDCGQVFITFTCSSRSDSD